MSFQDAKGVKRTLQGVTVTLPQRPALTIAPPLRGGRNWLVSEGPGNAHSHHWGSLLALNGVVTIPQRYAIDFVGLNERGHALEVVPEKPSLTTTRTWRDDKALYRGEGDAQSEAPAIILTANEVAFVREHISEMELCIVHSIEVEDGDRPRAHGGVLEVIRPWNPDRHDLKPLQYICHLFRKSADG